MKQVERIIDGGTYCYDEDERDHKTFTVTGIDDPDTTDPSVTLQFEDGRTATRGIEQMKTHMADGHVFALDEPDDGVVLSAQDGYASSRDTADSTTGMTP